MIICESNCGSLKVVTLTHHHNCDCAHQSVGKVQIWGISCMFRSVVTILWHYLNEIVTSFTKSKSNVCFREQPGFTHFLPFCSWEAFQNDFHYVLMSLHFWT